MINIALLGAGRIGKMHAEIINAHPKAKLQFVYDVNSDSAKQVSEENNLKSFIIFDLETRNTVYNSLKYSLLMIDSFNNIVYGYSCHLFLLLVWSPAIQPSLFSIFYPLNETFPATFVFIHIEIISYSKRVCFTNGTNSFRIFTN